MLNPSEKLSGDQSVPDELKSELDKLTRELDQFKISHGEADISVKVIEKSPRNIKAVICVLEEKITGIMVSASKCNQFVGDSKRKIIDLRRRLREVKLQVIKMEPSPAVYSSGHPSSSGLQSSLGLPIANIQGDTGKPVLRIKSFGGDASVYMEYRRIVVDQIINNPSLSEAAKWEVFRTSLTHRPGVFVRGWPETTESLWSFLEVLDMLYGEKEKAVHQLKDKFLSLMAEDNLDSCNSFHYRAEHYLKWLESLGHSINDDPDIVEKYPLIFPSSVKKAISQGVSVTLPQMRESVLAEIRKNRKDEAAKNQGAD